MYRVKTIENNIYKYDKDPDNRIKLKGSYKKKVTLFGLTLVDIEDESTQSFSKEDKISDNTLGFR